MPTFVLHQHAVGLSWVAKELIARGSHALVVDGRVWLIDPLDDPAAIERAQALGQVAGVLQLLDRHDRDCAALADRLGVPHLEVPDAVPGSPLEALRVWRTPGWKETALWWRAERVLVVAEVVGTNSVYTTGKGPAGIHLFLRLLAPSALRGYQPEHLLVGHGDPVHGAEAARALEYALDHSRSDIPRVLARLPKMLRGAG